LYTAPEALTSKGVVLTFVPEKTNIFLTFAFASWKTVEIILSSSFFAYPLVSEVDMPPSSTIDSSFARIKFTPIDSSADSPRDKKS
jgi:hypothetical protein